MTPDFPGSIRLSQVPAVVQPHEGRTSVISSTALPVFVKKKSCFTTSPALILPKSKDSLAKVIRGPECSVRVSFGAGAEEETPVWAKLKGTLPSVPTMRITVIRLVFIDSGCFFACRFGSLNGN